MRDESDEAHEEYDAGALFLPGGQLPVLLILETAPPHLVPKPIELVNLSISVFFRFVFNFCSCQAIKPIP